MNTMSVKSLSKLREKRQQREYEAQRDMMFDEYGHLLLFTGWGPSKKVFSDMQEALQENHETDYETIDKYGYF